MIRERREALPAGRSTQASGVRAGGLLLWAGIALGATACVPPPPPPAPRNVLLVSIDTLRADHLGCYGATAIETPAIDRLAEEGVRFERAFTSAPLTLPAHWTIHTGREPWRHGVVDNGMAPSAAVTAREELPTLAERFASSGYDTAAFVAAFVLHRSFGLDRGFATYDDGPAADAALEQPFHATAPADERVGRALAWLRQERHRPFFLWLHLFDPHAPYAPPPAFRTLYPGRPYDGEVAFVDSQIARLLAALDRLGERERTIVVLLADHGESLGEHGEETHGVLLYDATLRVPLIVRAPGQVPSGTVRHDPVTLADVAPTVLGLAGLAPLRLTDGIDLFATAPSASSRQLTAISESPRRRFGWAVLTAVRDDNWKYILGPTSELYDTATDPSESRNLLSTNAPRGQELESAARRTAALLRQRLDGVEPRAPDAEERARLAALGYLDGPTPQTTGPSNLLAPTHPREGIGTLAAIDRAYQALSEGRFGDAESDFRALLSLAPPPLAALEGLGRVARLQGEPEAAERWLEAVLDRDPTAVAVLAQLVTLARDRGDRAEALRRARKLAELAPTDPGASRLLAEALLAAGLAPEAEAEWRRGLDRSPDAGWLRLGLARYLANAHRAREAAAELDRLFADAASSSDLLEEVRKLRESLGAPPPVSGSSLP